MEVTALIAEDESLLATALQMDLQQAWPELEIVAMVNNGQSAYEKILSLRPAVVFLDIQMPGMTGIECVQALAEDWPTDGTPFPLVVFVTAYDQYAVQAFEKSAFDYILKPVAPVRLERTCARLKTALADRIRPVDAPVSAGSFLDGAMQQIRALLDAGPNAGEIAAEKKPLLQVIQASAGNTISLVPVRDVLYFEASDKYVRVVTAEGEHLIRMSLRELILQLDLNVFWQIHRSVVVRADAMAYARRDEAGKLTITLRGSSDKLMVSRLYAERFKGM